MRALRPLPTQLARLACLIVALGLSGSAQGQTYSLLPAGPSGPPTGGELELTGPLLPFPLATTGPFAPLYAGGTKVSTAGTPYWPPLLVPPTPGATVMQTGGTARGGAVVVPPGVLSRPAGGTPQRFGVFPLGRGLARFFQVATSIHYAWPATTATLAPSGGPGVPGTTVVQSAQGGSVTYSGSVKAFGGPARFSIAPGPGAGTGRVSPNATGALPILTAWINLQFLAPANATSVRILAVSNAAGLAQPGAPTAAPTATSMFGPVSPGWGRVNVTSPTPCCTMGPNGTVVSSIPLTGGPLSNRLTGSKGFPWTTGFVTITQGSGSIFFLSGTDMRVAGVGNVSLVSGALATRSIQGGHINRGWVSLNLPEPGAVVGATAALGTLALCHAGVRRRARSR